MSPGGTTAIVKRCCPSPRRGRPHIQPSASALSITHKSIHLAGRFASGHRGLFRFADASPPLTTDLEKQGWRGWKGWSKQDVDRCPVQSVACGTCDIPCILSIPVCCQVGRSRGKATIPGKGALHGCLPPDLWVMDSAEALGWRWGRPLRGLGQHRFTIAVGRYAAPIRGLPQPLPKKSRNKPRA